MIVPCQIRNRPRHAKDAGISARRKAHRLSRLRQQLSPRFIRRANLGQQIAVNFGIGSKAGCLIAACLPVPRSTDPRANLSRPFRWVLHVPMGVTWPLC